MTTRLPLRAVPQNELRAAWSAGRTYYEHPRREPRGLEKPVEAMTLDELIATQRMEPLSESRRSFLTTGEGVLSLNAPASPSGVVELMEFVADPGPAGLIPFIEDVDDEFDEVEHDAHRYGVPYDGPDFRTRDQIQWEQYVSQCEAPYHVAIKATEAGRLTVEDRSKRAPADFLKVARSALSSLFNSVGRAETIDQLHERVDLALDILSDPVAALYHSADARQERTRYLAPDDALAHSSFLDVDDIDDPDAIQVIRHRSSRLGGSRDELWHTDDPRWSSDPYEIGTDLCSNAETEALLGDVAWDEEGNLLDQEREQLLHNENAEAA